MKELKSVLKHLNKDEVNLASEKVELNKVEDLMKEGGKIGGNIKSLEMEILSMANDIKKESSKYDSLISEMSKLEKAAKELGVDNVAKDATEAIKFYKDRQRRADSMLNAVKGAIKR
jgi:predicted  nucleic acid-binding Zn-ribbon protein